MTLRSLVASALVGFLPAFSFGSVISGNFCSEANVIDTPAGVVPAHYWNNLTTPAGYGPTDSSSSLLLDDGSAATGVVASWTTSAGGSQNTNDYVVRALPPATLGNHLNDGDDQMMAGYLQASKSGPVTPYVTLKLTWLLSWFSSGFSIYLYSDGDQSVDGTSGFEQFQVWSSENDYLNSQPSLSTVYGRDLPTANYAIQNTGSTPAALYTPITSTSSAAPTVGNFVRFDLPANTDEVFVRIEGVTDTHGVALNGFQVVPEPSMMLLLVAPAMLLLRRRVV